MCRRFRHAVLLPSLQSMESSSVRVFNLFEYVASLFRRDFRRWSYQSTGAQMASTVHLETKGRSMLLSTTPVQSRQQSATASSDHFEAPSAMPSPMVHASTLYRMWVDVRKWVGESLEPQPFPALFHLMLSEPFSVLRSHSVIGRSTNR